MSVIIDAIIGIAILISFGIIFARSGIDMLTNVGGWLLGVGILFAIVIAIALYIHITNR